MVAVHGIPLDRYEGSSAKAAVTLSLSEQPRRDRLHSFQAEGWEVELRRGYDQVVARTNRPLAGNELIDAAIDLTHRALDLTSIEDGDHLVTKAPADAHIALEFANGRCVVRHQSVGDFPISVDTTITVTRADGTIEPQPVHPPLAWVPAFRFHRLSQGNSDLFDAFRNLFLGLESLLDQLFPKSRQEGEKAWLYRSVAAAGANVDLASLVTPGVINPARDLVDRIYAVRVNLFHAKTGRSLIPDERVSYIAVAEAYPILLALWTAIVRRWLPLKRGGGVITTQGFRMMIENAFGSARIGVTADDTPVGEAEASSSPRGLPTIVFAQPARVAEVRPGRMSLHGSTEVSVLPAGQVVGRVLALDPNSTPWIASAISGGLALDGADVFETIIILRLINRGQPRTEFS